MTVAGRLTKQQKLALQAIDSNFGQASEMLVWHEGVWFPRRTLGSLERRGLVRRVFWVDDYYGYMYERVPS